VILGTVYTSHAAQNSRGPVVPAVILVITGGFRFMLLCHPANVYPVRVGVGNGIGNDKVLYVLAVGTPVPPLRW
jgi:hypothetical protein